MNVSKKNTKSVGKYSAKYVKIVQDLYGDCNNALKNVLLKERPKLLMGECIDWGY